MRGPLIDVDHLDIGGDLHPRLAPVIIADVVARHLMAENQRVGTTPVQQAERDAGIPRVNQAALAFDEHDVVVLRALEDELLRGAGDEIRHDRVYCDAPPFDEDPRLPRRHKTRAVAALHERVAQLELRRHLADVAVGPDREHDQRVHLGRAAIGDGEVRRRLARIENANSARAGERTQLGIVADEGVQAAPDFQLALDGGAEPCPPFVGEAPPGRRDTDQDGGRPFALRDAALEIADHRNPAAEPEHVLRRLPRLFAIEHRDDALREIANARVGSLGRERPEVAVRDDEKPVLRRRHLTELAACRRSMPVHASVGRSTAGWDRPGSP